MAYNILIIDDSALTRTVMERTVRMCGVDINEIRTAAHGKEALEVLDSFWPDLVFCDINMPVMDGLQFIQALQNSDDWRDLPVVIVSTEGSETRMEELRRSGVQGYIRKPFAPEEVAAMIQQVLGATSNAR
ncbi:MAG: response regulator [bacterium]|nr:response regulator [bacterium]